MQLIKALKKPLRISHCIDNPGPAATQRPAGVHFNPGGLVFAACPQHDFSLRIICMQAAQAGDQFCIGKPAGLQRQVPALPADFLRIQIRKAIYTNNFIAGPAR